MWQIHAWNIDAKINEKELVNTSDITGFIDNSNLDKKIGTLATTIEIKAEQVKIMKRQVTIYWSNQLTIDSSYFRGKSQFEGDGTQNYLEF